MCLLSSWKCFFFSSFSFLLSTVFLYACAHMFVSACVFWGAHLLLKCCFIPGGPTRPLCSKSSSNRSDVNPDTQGYVCVSLSVCVYPTAFVLLLICVLDVFFLFNPIWVGQVGHCLLHDPGKLCQKGICTVGRTKYVYEETTLVTVWCSTEPSSEGVVLTFIYSIAIWT